MEAPTENKQDKERERTERKTTEFQSKWCRSGLCGFGVPNISKRRRFIVLHRIGVRFGLSKTRESIQMKVGIFK